MLCHAGEADIEICPAPNENFHMEVNPYKAPPVSENLTTRTNVNRLNRALSMAILSIMALALLVTMSVSAFLWLPTIIRYDPANPPTATTFAMVAVSAACALAGTRVARKVGKIRRNL